MLIKTLAENISNIEDLGSEHGLSIFIETKHHKLLFDTGAGALFSENAAKMKVNLAEVELAVISHGHYDHGGGLKTFLNINNKAKVYLQQKAFEKHYLNIAAGEKKDIGLDETLLTHERLVFMQDRMYIDEELELFSNVLGERLRPSGNRYLLSKAGESFMLDDFAHEQNLILNEDGKNVLVTGCAHNGIVNIIEHFRKEKNSTPDYIIGGFHLQDEQPDVVGEIGKYLMETKAKCYTCHCTGIESYKLLKAMLGENIEYLSTGSQLIL